MPRYPSQSQAVSGYLGRIDVRILKSGSREQVSKMADGSPWTAWALNAVYTGGTLCAGALLLLYVFQEKLLYYPTIPGAPKLTKENPRGRDQLPPAGFRVSGGPLLTRRVAARLPQPGRVQHRLRGSGDPHERWRAHPRVADEAERAGDASDAHLLPRQRWQ